MAISNLALMKLLLGNAHFRAPTILGFQSYSAEEVDAGNHIGSLFSTSSSDNSRVTKLVVASTFTKTQFRNAFRSTQNAFISLEEDLSIFIFIFILKSKLHYKVFKTVAGFTDITYLTTFKRRIFLTHHYYTTNDSSIYRNSIIERFSKILYDLVQDENLIDQDLAAYFNLDVGHVGVNYRSLRKLMITLATALLPEDRWAGFLSRRMMRTSATPFGNNATTTVTIYAQQGGVPRGVSSVHFQFMERFHSAWNEALRVAYEEYSNDLVAGVDGGGGDGDGDEEVVPEDGGVGEDGSDNEAEGALAGANDGENEDDDDDQFQDAESGADDDLDPAEAERIKRRRLMRRSDVTDDTTLTD